MKLLHIIATPRDQQSNTLRVSRAFLDGMKTKYPEMIVDEITLFNESLPAVAGQNIDTKYALVVGQPIDKNHKESWEQIEALIKHFLAADVYLISAPMWNFGIPYMLKYYIDAVVQPGYLYRYNEFGQPIPLTLGKKMVVITSRGGDYSAQSPLHAYDFQEPYLRSIFGFVGIYDMQFVNAQPMDITRDLREVAVAAAIEQAQGIVANFSWGDAAQAAAASNPAELKPQRK